MGIIGNRPPMANLYALPYLSRNRLMRRAFILLCLNLVLLTGCQENLKKEVNIMSSNAIVHLGEQGEAFAKRYPSQVHINRQPAGLDFYRIDWNAPAKGVVTFEHGKHTFTVENALDVSGYQNIDFPKEGMPELDITAGITGPNGIAHDEARQQMFAVLQKILQAGWKVFIQRDDPRVRGKDALDYVLTTSSASSLDATYLPTFEEWMRIESMTNWFFYADHVYLKVNFTREHTLTDPAKPGAYLINFNLQNEAEHFRGYVGPDNRKRWKELLPAALAKLIPMRTEAEAKMRAKGIQIDETYQDPPVPAF